MVLMEEENINLSQQLHILEELAKQEGLENEEEIIEEKLLSELNKEEISQLIQAKSNVFIKETLWRIWKRNKNVLIVVVGGTGSGKSYTALRIASEIDNTFTHDNLRQRVAYKPDQFFQIISQDLQKGQCLIIDEGGTTIDSREWYSFNNKAVSHILQTFRYENLVVIFTVPALNYIDVAARRLFHYYIEAIDVDYEKRKNIVKIYRLQYNPMLDKTYQKHFRTSVNGRVVKIKQWRLKKVKVKLWHEYEKFSQDQKRQIKKEVTEKAKRLREQETKKSQDRVSIQHIIDTILTEPLKFTRPKHPEKVPAVVIEAHFDVPYWYAMKAKELVEPLLRKKLEENAKTIIYD